MITAIMQVRKIMQVLSTALQYRYTNKYKGA